MVRVPVGKDRRVEIQSNAIELGNLVNRCHVVVLGLHFSRVSLFLCFDRIDGDDTC